MSTYSIKEGVEQKEGNCECGHSGAAHGSRGMICAACSCLVFREKEMKDESIVETTTR